jgi:hypothetical protein
MPGSRALVRPRPALVVATGWAAISTGCVAIWVAYEIGVFSDGWRPWLPWLPWLACALPPAAVGVLCLIRPRQAAAAGPAAVFAACAATAAYALAVPIGRQGLALAAAVLLLLCAGVSVIISATITAVMVSVTGGVSGRRLAAWTAAGLAFAGVQIASPLTVTGGPIQTVFAGSSGGGDADIAGTLVLLAVPLVIAGLGSARLATVIAIAWLPGAAAQMIGWYIFRPSFLHVDAWWYLSWLVWLAVVVLALAEARGWRAQSAKAGPE